MLWKPLPPDPSCLISFTPTALAAPSCTLQVAGVAGSSATYATLCDVFAKQGKWDKLRTAVQVKGEWLPGVTGHAACSC